MYLIRFVVKCKFGYVKEVICANKISCLANDVDKPRNTKTQLINGLLNVHEMNSNEVMVDNYILALQLHFAIDKMVFILQ